MLKFVAINNDILTKHIEMIEAHYDINPLQLGLVMLFLASLRASMGHENARSTIRDYIHTNELSPQIKECIEFIEREILALKKSRIDTDYYKIGNRSVWRDE